jgi:hypothetical protein
MRLITLFVVLVALTVSVNAQHDDQNKTRAPGTSIIKIDGKFLQANSYEEFKTLLRLTKSVNLLKKQRAEKRLTKEMYNNAVSALFDDAKIRGIVIN